MITTIPQYGMYQQAVLCIQIQIGSEISNYFFKNF